METAIAVVKRICPIVDELFLIPLFIHYRSISVDSFHTKIYTGPNFHPAWNLTKISMDGL
jgi:hypothetical protein